MGRPGNPEKSGSRRARRAWAIGLGAALALGCRSSTEFVEAELRYQCRRAAELERQVAGKDAEIVTLKAAVSNLQQATAAKPAPETTEEVYRKTALARIELAIMSGGKDMDGDGKDDGVQAAISPMDFDGDVFKCPGSVKLALFENLNSGLRKPLGEWTFDADRTRDSWQSSLMGAGYRLYAPWIEAPRVKKLRMVVTFTTLDGREFGAEKDFEVSLAAKRPPKTPPSDPAPPKPDVMTKTAQDSPPKLTIAEKPGASRPEKHAEKQPKENGAAAFKPAELASLRMLPPAPAAAEPKVAPPTKAKAVEKSVAEAKKEPAPPAPAARADADISPPPALVKSDKPPAPPAEISLKPDPMKAGPKTSPSLDDLIRAATVKPPTLAKAETKSATESTPVARAAEAKAEPPKPAVDEDADITILPVVASRSGDANLKPPTAKGSGSPILPTNEPAAPAPAASPPKEKQGDSTARSTPRDPTLWPEVNWRGGSKSQPVDPPPPPPLGK